MVISMTYRIPPDIEERIEAHLAGGQYENKDAVLREAIQALDDRKTDFAAIQSGIDDMESGRFKTFDEFDQEFRRKHNIT